MLLEVLPALAVLLLAIMGSMRLVWAAMDHSRARVAAHWREGVLPVVWQHWEAEASGVAVVHEADDGPQVRLFPSVAWIPGNPNETGHGFQMILRKDPVDLQGWPAWRVSRRVSGDGGTDRWQVLFVVLRERAMEGAP